VIESEKIQIHVYLMCNSVKIMGHDKAKKVAVKAFDSCDESVSFTSILVSLT
jgi:hypothetical protein